MPAWPRRRPIRTTTTVPPDVRRIRPEEHQEKPEPRLVPRNIPEAFAAAIILILATIAVAYLFELSSAAFVTANLPGRIWYGAIGVGALFVFTVFVISLILYVLPVMIGVRKR